MAFILPYYIYIIRSLGTGLDTLLTINKNNADTYLSNVNLATVREKGRLGTKQNKVLR